jgi:hypothetical protein
MEPKTNPILLPKDIYRAYLDRYIQLNPGTVIARSKESPRIAMPWEIHCAKTGEVLMTYTRWYNIMSVFFEQAKVCIIQGQRLYMRTAGFIYAKRIERNFRNKQINWQATNAQPKVFDTAKQKMVPKYKVYFTEPDYCRIGWLKGARSRASVKFEPTHSSSTSSKRTRKGFKQQFSQALQQNPALKFKYLYFPYIRKDDDGTQ